MTATTDGHAYSYDAAGNVNCRAIASGGCSGPSPSGAPYTYDNEGRLSVWANKPSGATVSAKELYDGSGERVARQTTSSGVLTTSVYAGPLAEYDTTGSSTTTTDYFHFAGQTVAIRDTNWHYLVADQLGSPVVQLNASGNPELDALKLPYGAGRYAAASLANLGFTGQRKDSTPNLTYFHARFYDQEVGVFLSPDRIRAGPNPYAYVGGRVESATDPSGHMPVQSMRNDGLIGDAYYHFMVGLLLYDQNFGGTLAMGLALHSHQAFAQINLWGQLHGAHSAVQLAASGEAVNFWHGMTNAQKQALFNADPAMAERMNLLQFSAVEAAGATGNEGKPSLVEAVFGGSLRAGPSNEYTGTDDFTGSASGDNGSASGDGQLCSFAASTPVATPHGELPIASLRVGDTVEAYNPKTGQAEPEPVQHVWINHDHDLVDVHLAASITTATTRAAGGVTRVNGHGWLVSGDISGVVLRQHQFTANTTAGETIHTTANHPWLTADRGWVPAGDLRAGEAVVSLGGNACFVLWVRVVPGEGTRYNLTVSHHHTYAVGAGKWIVHNTGCGDLIDQARQAASDEGRGSATAVQATDIGAEPVELSQSVFTSKSPADQSPAAADHFGDIIAQEQSRGEPHSAYAGGCGEVGACVELYGHADELNGGSVDMGLYQKNSIGPCPTCQRILQQTANELNVAINLEDGVHDPWVFFPEE